MTVSGNKFVEEVDITWISDTLNEELKTYLEGISTKELVIPIRLNGLGILTLTATATSRIDPTQSASS